MAVGHNPDRVLRAIYADNLEKQAQSTETWADGTKKTVSSGSGYRPIVSLDEVFRPNNNASVPEAQSVVTTAPVKPRAFSTDYGAQTDAATRALSADAFKGDPLLQFNTSTKPGTFDTTVKAVGAGALDTAEGIVRMPGNVKTAALQYAADTLAEGNIDFDALAYGDADTYRKAVEEAEYNKNVKSKELQQRAQQAYEDTQNIKLYDDNGKIRQFINQTKEDMASLESAPGRFVAQLGYSAGQMAPAIALGLATGGLGTAAGLANAGALQQAASIGTLFSSVYSRSLEDAVNGGADLSTAYKKALGDAVVEAGTEIMFGGIPGFGEGVLDDVMRKVAQTPAAQALVAKLGTTQAGQVLSTVAAGMADKLGRKVAGQTIGDILNNVIGEGIEEMVSEVLTPFIDRATVNPNAENASFSQVMLAGLSGSLLSIALGGMSAVAKMPQYARSQQAIKDSLSYLNNIHDEGLFDAATTERLGIDPNLVSGLFSDVPKLQYVPGVTTMEDVSEYADRLASHAAAQADFFNDLGLPGMDPAILRNAKNPAEVINAVHAARNRAQVEGLMAQGMSEMEALQTVYNLPKTQTTEQKQVEEKAAEAAIQNAKETKARRSKTAAERVQEKKASSAAPTTAQAQEPAKKSSKKSSKKAPAQAKATNVNEFKDKVQNWKAYYNAVDAEAERLSAVPVGETAQIQVGDQLVTVRRNNDTAKTLKKQFSVVGVESTATSSPADVFRPKGEQEPAYAENDSEDTYYPTDEELAQFPPEPYDGSEEGAPENVSAASQEYSDALRSFLSDTQASVNEEGPLTNADALLFSTVEDIINRSDSFRRGLEKAGYPLDGIAEFNSEIDSFLQWLNSRPSGEEIKTRMGELMGKFNAIGEDVLSKIEAKGVENASREGTPETGGGAQSIAGERSVGTRKSSRRSRRTVEEVDGGAGDSGRSSGNAEGNRGSESESGVRSASSRASRSQSGEVKEVSAYQLARYNRPDYRWSQEKKFTIVPAKDLPKPVQAAAKLIKKITGQTLVPYKGGRLAYTDILGEEHYVLGWSDQRTGLNVVNYDSPSYGRKCAAHESTHGLIRMGIIDPAAVLNTAFDKLGFTAQQIKNTLKRVNVAMGGRYQDSELETELVCNASGLNNVLQFNTDARAKSGKQPMFSAEDIAEHEAVINEIYKAIEERLTKYSEESSPRAKDYKDALRALRLLNENLSQEETDTELDAVETDEELDSLREQLGADSGFSFLFDNDIRFMTDDVTEQVEEERAKQNRFYSRAAAIIRDTYKGKEMAVDSIIPWIDKRVKADEMQWSGVRDWVAKLKEAGTKSVSPEDVAKYFDDHMVVVTSDPVLLPRADGPGIADFANYTLAGRQGRRLYQGEWLDANGNYITPANPANYTFRAYRIPGLGYTAPDGHFNDSGKDVFAHARFEDVESVVDGEDGSPQSGLLVEEIQSDLHNAALRRDKAGNRYGYLSDEYKNLSETERKDKLLEIKAKLDEINPQVTSEYRIVFPVFDELEKANGYSLDDITQLSKQSLLYKRRLTKALKAQGIAGTFARNIGARIWSAVVHGEIRRASGGSKYTKISSPLNDVSSVAKAVADSYYLSELRAKEEFGDIPPKMRRAGLRRVLLSDEVRSALENYYNALAETARRKDALHVAEESDPRLARFNELRKRQGELLAEYYHIQDMMQGAVPPAAPFKNTYQDYVIRDLLYEAAAQGKDFLAFTTAQQQVKRWSEASRKAYTMEYDKQIPKVLNEIGKKYGESVHDMKINPDITNPGAFPVTVHGFNITDDMRRDILNQGFPQFMRDDTDTVSPDPLADQIRSAMNEVNAKMSELDKAWAEAGGTDTTAPTHFGDELVGRFVRNVYEDPRYTPNYTELQKRRIVEGMGRYTVLSNNKLVDSAYKWLDKFMIPNPHGEDTLDLHKAYTTYMAALENQDVITADMVAKGEILLASLAQKGQQATNEELAMWERLVSALDIRGRELGRAVQAYSLLKSLTPRGRAFYIEKAIEAYRKELSRSGKKLAAAAKALDIDKDPTLQKLLNELVATETAHEGEQVRSAEEIEDEIIDYVASKVPATWRSRAIAWRYLAMLGNPLTHFRNFYSNIVFGLLNLAKDEVKGGVEDLISVFNKDFAQNGRTRTLFKGTSQAIKDFVAQDFEVMKHALFNNGRKGDVRNRIAERVNPFGKGWVAKKINAAARFNNWMLGDIEDGLFIKWHYKRSLANYLAARNIDPASFISGDPKSMQVLADARRYAMTQAFRDTFHEANAVADALNRIERSHPMMQLLLGGVIPFKQTPLNILKQGIRYSGGGLVTGLIKLVQSVNEGSVKLDEAIDDLATTIPAGGLAALGYFLGGLGFAKGKLGEGDKDKYYQQMLGEQEYSIRFGNKTYTFDWLSPSAMPFFVGVELASNGSLSEMLDLTPTEMVNALTNMADPITNMSMLQGINEAIQSYENRGPLEVLMGAAEGYASQFLPTLGGQFARAVDPVRRATYASKDTDFFGGQRAEKFVNRLKNKIPGAASKNEPYIDMWGREETRPTGSAGAVARRWAEQFLSPGYVKDINRTKVDDMISNLYESTGNTAVLPSKPNSYFTVDKKKYNLSPEDYTTVEQIDGRMSYRSLDEAMKNPYYNRLPDSDKEKIVTSIYSFSGNVAKEWYCNKEHIKLTKDSTIAKVEEALAANLSIGDYFVFSRMFNHYTKVAEKKELAAELGLTEAQYEIVK